MKEKITSKFPSNAGLLKKKISVKIAFKRFQKKHVDLSGVIRTYKITPCKNNTMIFMSIQAYTQILAKIGPTCNFCESFKQYSLITFCLILSERTIARARFETGLKCAIRLTRRYDSINDSKFVDKSR